MEIISRAKAKARGLTRYFTGKPCPHGHIAERLTSNGTCVVCTRTKADKWAAEVSGTIKPCKYGHNAPRTANGACSECEKIGAAREFAEDPERVRGRSRRYYGNHTEERRADRREYGRNNREKETAAHRAWREANPEKVLASQNKKHEKDRERLLVDPEFRAAKNARNAAWDAANPDKVRAKHRRIKNTKYAESIEFRVTCAIRNGVNGAMRGKKFGRSLELIGCTVAELVSHIESQFRDGMTWDNWGKSETGGWELDHRKAIGLHNLTVREECFAAFHYSNLQPLLMDEHKRKTRLDHEAIRLQKRRSGSSAR